ncbi:MAG: ATP-binding cassette domain-containing protein [Planctomycetota bacterium]|nr:ATP-binding cassette domain-containing protein [Planctomycetota bacterium]
MPAREMISVRSLVKRYGDVVAVRGIDLSVRQGEILGFLGPNGAGKSTTIKIITSFVRGDAGEVKVAGMDVKTHSLEVRRKIGYLPETCPLYHEMRVIDFLKYIAEMRAIPSAGRKKQISRVVDICGLGEVLMKGISELSKGYRQRTGLAQAMIHEPDILLLDEPTSGLDPNQIVEIRKLIKEIGREKTVILSTHILPEVAATCGRVVIIHQGEIVADGTVEDLQKQAKEGLLLSVRLKGRLEGIEKRLSEIPSVEAVKQISLLDGQEGQFEIRPKKGADLAEEIFHFAVREKLVLKEMHPRGASLEDVFHQLTR